MESSNPRPNKCSLSTGSDNRAVDIYNVANSEARFYALICRLYFSSVVYRIHIHRLKHGFAWVDKLQEDNPPIGVDAI
jgi:hypothetical protein